MKLMSQPLSFRQTFDRDVEVRAGDNTSAATYRFGALPKACIHPLLTHAGHCVTGYEMSDHVWHRGIWFTIKLINGSNFWEENAPFGIQESQSQPTCQLIAPDALRLAHQLNWTSQATDIVIREQRTVIFRPAAGIIDWSTELLATQDLTLDRTPYTTWGGYGGLSYRATRQLHDANFLLPYGETVTGLAGQPHDWVVVQGSLDDGPDQRISLAMIDHPANPRSPSPWYCKAANGYGAFMNAAFLFHEKMMLPRGQVLRFNYRVCYRDGTWSVDEFTKIAQEFRST
jgi:hypothetical protein